MANAIALSLAPVARPLVGGTVMEYRFIDKDPIIDLIRTAYLDSNLMAHEVAQRARLAPSTIDNMLYGKTKRPQHRTVMAIFAVFGIKTSYTYEATDVVVEARPGVAHKFRRKPKRGMEEQHKLRAIS